MKEGRQMRQKKRVWANRKQKEISRDGFDRKL